MSKYGSSDSFDHADDIRCPAVTDAAAFPFERHNYQGLEIVRSFSSIYSDARVWNLVRDVLSQTYSKFFGTAGQEICWSALLDLREYSHDPEETALAQMMLRRREQFENSEMFTEYYGSYREQNLLSTISILGKRNFSGVVADIGCDDNRLGQLINIRCGSVRKVIGTDIHSPPQTSSDPQVEFRLAPDEATLPLETNEADTIVIRYALHHMQWPVQEKILDEVRRVLAPGGKLLILENSFSRTASMRLADGRGFEARTRVLDEAGLLRVLLTALDTFSLFIKDKFGPFPSTYRTAEEWGHLLSSMGLRVSWEYLGYSMHDLHQAPLSVLRCD